VTAPLRAFGPWSSARVTDDWFAWEMTTSYYNTNALKCTLERLVDFDHINNSNEMRLSVGR
jgi:hypothetical protein